VRVAQEGRRKRGKREGKFERTERTKEEMSAVESALDVLSRAATMMQGQFIFLGILFRDLFCTDKPVW